MFTLPLLVLISLLGTSLTLSVAALSSAQLCSDMMDGLVRHEVSVTALLTRRHRANRTLSWSLFFTALFIIAVAVEFQFTLL